MTDTDAPIARHRAGSDQGYDVMQPPRRRRWGWLVAVVLVAAVAAFVLSRDGERRRGPEVTYLTTQPASMDLEETVEGDVTIELDGDTLAIAPAGGVVTAVHVAEGAVPGPLAPMLDVSGETRYLLPGPTPPYRELSDGSEGPDVETLEAALEDAGYDPGEVDETFDDATADAVAAWQEDEDLEATGMVDPTLMLWAPSGSEVLELAVDVGDRVEPGAPLIRLGDPTRLQATVILDQQDVPAVAVGDPVTLEIDGIPEAVRGEVGRIAATGEDGFRLEVAALEVPDGLRAGMSGTAEIVVEVRRNVLTVPTGAVSGTRAAPTVEVLVDGEPQTRGIQTGVVTPQHTEVVSGLAPEDQVVIGREEG